MLVIYTGMIVQGNVEMGEGNVYVPMVQVPVLPRVIHCCVDIDFALLATTHVPPR